MNIYRIASVVVLVGTFTMSGPPAKADLTIDITQVGSDVVAMGSGTLNLTALSGPTEGFAQTGMTPSLGNIAMGPVSGQNAYDLYQGIIGPSTFGSGGTHFSSTGVGDAFGIDESDALLSVPNGYVSGHSLSSTDTYSGATFSSLGLTTGTYTWTWGTGSSADSFTLQIGPAAVVPEPSTAIVAVFGAVAFLAYGWSRHRRQQRRQVSA